MARTRVICPPSFAAYLCGAAAVGLVAGITFHYLNKWLSNILTMTVVALAPLVVTIVFIALFVLVLAIASFLIGRAVSAHWRRFLIGAVFGACYTPGWLLWGMAGQPGALTIGIEMAMLVIWFGVMSVVAGAMYGAFLLLGCLVTSTLTGRPVYQTGSLCTRCAYDLVGTPETKRCSECGDHDPWRKIRAQLARAAARRKWRTIVIGLSIAMSVFVTGRTLVMSAAAGMETRALLKNVASNYRITRAVMMVPPPAGSMFGTPSHWETRAAVLSIEGEPNFTLFFCFTTSPEPGQPTVQLQLVGSDFSYGNWFVLCDLDAQQAAQVYANGVPRSLVREMIDRAKAAKWKPTPPGGGMANGYLHIEAAPHIEVE